MEELHSAAVEADGFSFAQLRESYILAGQLAFDSHSPVQIDALRSGINTVRCQMTAVKCADGSKVGFESVRR
jgi:hypothetical protein